MWRMRDDWPVQVSPKEKEEGNRHRHRTHGLYLVEAMCVSLVQSGFEGHVVSTSRGISILVWKIIESGSTRLCSEASKTRTLSSKSFLASEFPSHDFIVSIYSCASVSSLG